MAIWTDGRCEVRVLCPSVGWRLLRRCQEQQPFISGFGAGREGEADEGRCLKARRSTGHAVQEGLVDREYLTEHLTDAISRDGKLALILGGKSVGKTLVISHVADTVRQAPGGNRRILLVNTRHMPANDFHEATLSVASKQSNVLEILTQLPLFGKRFRAGYQSRIWRFIQQLPFMPTLLGLCELERHQRLHH